MREEIPIATEERHRIDAHHHVWDLAVRAQPWTARFPTLQRSFGFDELRSDLVAHGFDTSVVVQTLADPTETTDLLALVAVEPLLRGVVGWVDLTAPDLADRLADLRAGPGGDALVAVRHPAQGEPDPEWLVRPEVLAGLATVGAAGLAFDLLVREPQLPAALRAARQLPQVRFVLDHAGKPVITEQGPDQTWLGALQALAALPNIAVKISGLVSEAGTTWTPDRLRPYHGTILDLFGPDRVMFGSDWPVCTCVATYAEVVALGEAATAGLTVEGRAAVFGGTAARWYALRGTG